MKKMFMFLVCILLLLSCNKDSDNNIISAYFEETRNLMMVNPREALDFLLNINDSIESLQQNPYLKNEFNILLAEAHFKNGYKQPNKNRVEESTCF